MKKTILSLAAVVTLITTQAQLSQDTIVGEVVHITATKTLRKQNETGKVVTVISKETLQNNIGKTLGQVLNQQAGIFIVGANNAPGSNQELYFRGSGKVLVLLDGIPVYDASTINNSFDLNSINLESIEKIEILKGAQSTLYGSDAVAGVVNILTKKSSLKEIEGYVNVSAGSFNTYKGTVGISGLTDGTTYNISLNHLKSNGFSAAFDSTSKKNYDKDGIAQTSFNGNINGKVANNFTVGVQTQLSTYKADADGSAFVDDKDYTINNINLNLGVNAKYTLKKGAIFYNASLNTANRNYLNDSFDVSGFSKYSKENYIGKSYFTELYTTQKINENIEIIAGVDYRALNSNQDYYSLSIFGPYETTIGKDSVKQNMKSAFASLLVKNLNGFNIEVGGRYNKHSTYGNNTTFTVNPSYVFNSNLRVFANIFSAFKAPSLYQLFGPGVENRLLKAETSLTYEGGLQYSNKKWNVRAVYFNRNIKNGIDYNLNTFAYFNNNIQKDNGAELELSTKLGKFNITGNYTFLDGKVNTKIFEYNSTTFGYDVKGDTVFNNLFRRPKHSINVNIAYQPTKNWLISSSFKSIGKRWEGQFQASPIALKSYYSMDLFVAYNYNKKVRVYVDWSNITNQQYFDVLGYNTRRNNFMGGIQIMF